MFGSRGAEEMSVFHTKLDGNGTKPLRLAFSPVLIPLHAGPVVGCSTVMFRLAVADCGVGWVESVTSIATGDTPTALSAGVPVTAPVELLIERLLGRPVAL